MFGGTGLGQPFTRRGGTGLGTRMGPGMWFGSGRTLQPFGSIFQYNRQRPTIINGQLVGRGFGGVGRGFGGVGRFGPRWRMFG